MSSLRLYLKKDPIDDDMFSLYANAVPFKDKPKYHVAAIHRDFISDLLKEASEDPDDIEAVLTMQPADMVELGFQIEIKDWH